MDLLITFLLAYITGVFVMALIIRWGNAKETSKSCCMPPKFCLLSWFGVSMFIAFYLEESSKDGFIAKLFKYTNKNNHG